MFAGVVGLVKYAGKRFDKLQWQCHHVIHVFECDYCNPGRLFTDKERENFAKEHSDLYNECKAALNNILAKFQHNGSDLPKLIKLIDSLPQLQEENNNLYWYIKDINKQSAAALSEIRERCKQSSFICHSYAKDFIDRYESLYHKIPGKPNNTKCKEILEYIDNNSKEFLRIYDTFSSKQSLKDWNESSIKKDLEKNHSYFSDMFDYPLDGQQRESIVDLEDNVLVIASAGSGKTSTIIGKANYLIHKLGVDPSKLLLVTYTARAAQELQNRIDAPGVEAATFHKHAMDTIGLVTGSKPTLASEDLLSQIFLNLFDNNTDFRSWFIKFETGLQNLTKDPFDYKTAKEFIADMEKYGNLAPYKDMNGNVKRLHSKQEIDIFVYLTELGLDIRYEEYYPYDTSDNKHGRYKPDFAIHYTELVLDESGYLDIEQKTLYLEHFGIDRNGNVPRWFGDGLQGGWEIANRKYNEGIVWKKQVHQRYGTQFAYTTSADFTDGTIYNVINDIITRFNIPVKHLTDDEKLAKLSRSIWSLQTDTMHFTSSFIVLMKANGLNIESVLSKVAPNDEFKQRNIDVIEHIIRPIYTEYQSRLKKDGVVDFTDILLNAAELCTTRNPRDYDYILVDEFQDMSMDKYRYLNSIRRKSITNTTHLFCVGDDWQSIYRFAGNDMTLFFDYQKFFGYTSTRRIETTHRFAEPLITQSSNFILKNPKQLKKIVRQDSAIRRTELEFYSYLSEDEEKEKIDYIIENLPANCTISIIARYNYEIEQLFNLRRNDNSRFSEIKIKGKKVRLMSVHSAKGLESDYIIIIGCKGGIHGFPSLIEDDPVLKYVLSTADDFENAEERRVFYVAITRAKKCAYVLYDYNNRSAFVDEFISHYSKAELCPRCQNGKIIPLRDGIASTGNYYSLIRCDNPYCDYFEAIFYEDVKVYSLASFASRYFPVSMCEPQMEEVNGQPVWRFAGSIDSHEPEIVLNLSPKLRQPADIHELVVVECKHDKMIRRFASDRVIDNPTIVDIQNNSIEKVIDVAIQRSVDVVIRYQKYDGEQSERQITPIRYATVEDNHWYYSKSHVKAFCHLRNEERDFCIERISAIRYTDSQIWIDRHE